MTSLREPQLVLRSLREPQLVLRSLLTHDPLRDKSYAHVISVRTDPVTGKQSRTRGRQHRRQNLDTPGWIEACNIALLEAAQKAGAAVGTEKAWLEDRSLALVDPRKVLHRSDINQWLHSYGHAAFALGIHLPGPKGETIATPHELPRRDFPESRMGKALVIKAGVTGMKHAKAREHQWGAHGALISADTRFYPRHGGVRYLSATEQGRVGRLLAKYAARGLPVEYRSPATGRGLLATHAPGLLVVQHAPAVAREAQPGAADVFEVLRESVRHWSKPKTDRYALSDEDAKAVQALPREDLGFDPREKPVSYLVSLGWDEQGPEGNRFSKEETACLLFEFESFMTRQVKSVTAKYLGANKHSKQALHRRELGGRLKSDAVAYILEHARRWTIAARGVPSRGSNFVRFVLGTLPKELEGRALEFLREQRETRAYAEELETASGAGSVSALSGTHFESPEQYTYRQELGRQVEQLWEQHLTPIEHVIVMSRLNIVDPQTEGVYASTLTTPQGEKIALAPIKPWAAVHNDVLEALAKLPAAPTREASVLAVSRMTDKQLDKLFQNALAKLRARYGKTTTSSERAAVQDVAQTEHKLLAEWATLQRSYYEGVRHKAWDPAAQYGKLAVSRSQRKPSLCKGFVIPQARQAFADLLAEYRLWIWNGF